MADSQDLFEEENILTPVESSGVSADTEGGTHQSTQESSPVILPVVPLHVRRPSGRIMCQEPGCLKAYETETGFVRHFVSHKVSNINKRKPTIDDVVAVIHELLEAVLTEIRDEPCYTDEGEKKRTFVCELMKKMEGTNWQHFISSVADFILYCLLQTTKLLPSNVYEETLVHFHAYINENYADLSKSLMIITESSFEVDETVAGRVLFRLCFKLMDKLQVFIVNFMRKIPENTAEDSNCNTELSGEVKGLLTEIGNILRAVFRSGKQNTSHLWQIKCACLRKRFVFRENAITSKEFLKPSLWVTSEVSVGSQISLSRTAFEFFCLVESVIRSYKLKYSKDVVQKLLENTHALYFWFKLTDCFLRESDSFGFMSEVVTPFVNNSVRAETKRLNEECIEERLSTAVALRTAFKGSKRSKNSD